MGKNKDKVSKDLQEVSKAINKYLEKKGGEVVLLFSVLQLEGKNSDNRILAYGSKDCLLFSLEGVTKEVKKVKGGKTHIGWLDDY